MRERIAAAASLNSIHWKVLIAVSRWRLLGLGAGERGIISMISQTLEQDVVEHGLRVHDGCMMSTWSCCSKSIYIYSSSAASNLNLYILHALVPVFIVSNQVQRALFDQAMNAGPAIILQLSLFNLPFNAKNLSQVDDSVRRVCIGEKHRLTSIYRFVRVCSPCYFSPPTGMPWVHQFPLFVIWLISPSSNTTNFQFICIFSGPHLLMW